MGYAASLTACTSLEDEDRANAHVTQGRITYDQLIARLNINRSRTKDLMEILQTDQRHVIGMASEKGASNRLTALPLKSYGLTLTKSKFRDGLALDRTLRPEIRPLIGHVMKNLISLSHFLHCARRKGMHT